MNTQTEASEFRKTVTRELALFSGLLFFGLVLLPVLIYQVGQTIFGTYGGVGYGDFFARLGSKIRSGDVAAWFLVLAPYIGWQVLRLLALAWRKIGRLQ